MKTIDSSAQAVIERSANKLAKRRKKFREIISQAHDAGKFDGHRAFDRTKTVRPRFFSFEKKTIWAVWIIVTYMGAGDYSYKALLGADGNVYSRWGTPLNIDRLSKAELKVGIEEFRELFG